jgi:hypothetical protein
MPGKFKCPACAREYIWKPELAGRRGKCRCGAAVIVPTEDPGRVVIPEESNVESREAAHPPVVAHVAEPPQVRVPEASPAPMPLRVAEPTPVAPPTVVRVVAPPQAPIPVSPAAPEPVVESMPVAPPPDASPVGVVAADEIAGVRDQGHCQICGAIAPTRHVEFHQNIGMLIMRRHRTLRGELCRNCINQNFWKMTGITLAVGWASTISLVLAPIFLVRNTVRYLSCRSLPASRSEG